MRLWSLGVRLWRPESEAVEAWERGCGGLGVRLWTGSEAVEA